MRSSTNGLSLLSLWLVGCSWLAPVNEDNWISKYSKATCDYSQRCAAAQFFYNYDDIDECIEEMEEVHEDLEDYYDDCDFEQDHAEDCLTMLRSSCREIGEDLDDFWDDCGRVWDCTR